MTTEEIRKNAPNGATHYKTMEMMWITPRVYYFAVKDTIAYEWISGRYAPYPSSCSVNEIKPL